MRNQGGAKIDNYNGKTTSIQGSPLIVCFFQNNSKYSVSMELWIFLVVLCGHGILEEKLVYTIFS